MPQSGSSDAASRQLPFVSPTLKAGGRGPERLLSRPWSRTRISGRPGHSTSDVGGQRGCSLPASPAGARPGNPCSTRRFADESGRRREAHALAQRRARLRGPRPACVDGRDVGRRLPAGGAAQSAVCVFRRVLPSSCRAWTPGPSVPSAETAPGASELFPAPFGALGTPAPKCKRSPPNSRGDGSGGVGGGGEARHQHVSGAHPGTGSTPLSSPPPRSHSPARHWWPPPDADTASELHATRARPRRRNLDRTPPWSLWSPAFHPPSAPHGASPEASGSGAGAWVLQLALRNGVPAALPLPEAGVRQDGAVDSSLQTEPCGEEARPVECRSRQPLLWVLSLDLHPIPTCLTHRGRP